MCFVCVFVWVVARLDRYLGTSEDELKFGLVFLGEEQEQHFLLCNFCVMLHKIYVSMHYLLLQCLNTKINPPVSAQRSSPGDLGDLVLLHAEWMSPWERDTEWRFPWILLKPHKTEYSYVYSTGMEENFQIQSCDWPNKCPAGQDKTNPGQWEISSVFWNFLHFAFLSCWLFICIEAAPSVKDKLHTLFIWGVPATCFWK